MCWRPNRELSRVGEVAPRPLRIRLQPLLDKQMVHAFDTKQARLLAGPTQSLRGLEREMGFDPTALCLGCILPHALC